MHSSFIVIPIISVEISININYNYDYSLELNISGVSISYRNGFTASHLRGIATVDIIFLYLFQF